MSTKARLENNTVVEILTAEPFPPFHSSFIWVECDPTVKIGWLYNGSNFVAPTPKVPVEQDYVSEAQTLLDSTAKQRGYDGILSLCTYATSSNDTFKKEGQAGVLWRDAVWATSYDIMAKVKAGEMTQPTLSQFLAILPTFQWPE